MEIIVVVLFSAFIIFVGLGSIWCKWCEDADRKLNEEDRMDWYENEHSSDAPLSAKPNTGRIPLA